MTGVTAQARREGLKIVLPKVQTREQAILDVLRGREMTSREIMRALGYSDPNMVRPRISSLLNKGLIEELESRRLDPDTHVRVTVFRAVE